MEETFPDFFPIFITFLVFIFVTIKLLKKSTNSSKLPPGPWKLPIIGNMHQVASSPLLHRKLHELALKHGPLMHLQLGGVSTIVVSSPELAKEVLKTHDLNFSNRPFVFAVKLIYNCRDLAFAPYGEYWRQMRKICMLELLSAKRVQSFRSVREREVLHLIRSISSSSGTVLNVSKILTSTTMRIIAASAFGNIGKHHEAFMSLLTRTSKELSKFHISDLFPSLYFLDEILPSKLKGFRREFDDVLGEIIKEHKEVKKRGEKRVDGAIESLVDVLLKHEDQNNSESDITAKDIQAIITEMFAAGLETSATTMDWALSEMLKNPRVLQKAQAEVRLAFRGEDIEESKLQSLEYLKSVIKEALRLHPPSPLLLPRESQERAVVGGYDIPSRTRAIVNAWAIGRDPRYWEEPEKFYPERFINSPVDYTGFDFQFIPFGAGRRICPGINFSIASIELVLANLLCHFDWSLPGDKGLEDLVMLEVAQIVGTKKNDLYLIPTLCKLQASS